jgi:serine/threonine-protein kinase
MPDDPAAVAEITAVRALIDGARALELRGELDGAYAEAVVAANRAAAIDHAPLRMEVLKELAEWQEHVGRYTESEATLTEMATLAARIGDNDGLADATIKMLWLAGTRRYRFEEAEAYARLAGALVERTTRTELRASRLLAIGAVRIQQGDFAAAKETLDAALAIYEELGDPLDLAAVYTQRAQARGNLGEVAGALADMEHALELRRATLGDDHPAVAASLSNVALWEKNGARYDAALVHAREAVAIMERRAPDHPHLGSILQVLGLILAGKGEDDEAIALFERALPLLAKAQGADSPDVADLLNSLGFSLRARERPADALARHEEALRIVERSLGPVHPSTADTLVSVGLALVDLGRLDDADAAYRRALAAYEASVPAGSPRLAVILTNIGELANLRHAYRDGLAACERALAIDEHNLGADHPDLAYDLMCSGDAHAGLGAWDAAITASRRALELRQAAGAGAEDIAAAQKQLDDYLASSSRSR